MKMGRSRSFGHSSSGQASVEPKGYLTQDTISRLARFVNDLSISETEIVHDFTVNRLRHAGQKIK